MSSLADWNLNEQVRRDNPMGSPNLDYVTHIQVILATTTSVSLAGVWCLELAGRLRDTRRENLNFRACNLRPLIARNIFAFLQNGLCCSRGKNNNKIQQQQVAIVVVRRRLLANYNNNNNDDQSKDQNQSRPCIESNLFKF